MQKLEDVVIPMPLNFKELEFKVGSLKTIEEMPSIPSLIPFDNRVIEFFSRLSNVLLKTGTAFSDVITFAFWCRKASLLSEKEKYDKTGLRFGRGLVFHSTPSNVPVNFAFSFAAGLLAGNTNIVRLPAKDFAQVEIICNAINEALKIMPEMSPYVVMVRFPSLPPLLDYFSSICSSRMIWGGDVTISNIRKSPLSPRANDITFADRHSILLLNSDAILASADLNTVVQKFYNDTYYSDQNACTAPRLIVWLGDNKDKAKEVFWSAVQKYIQAKYSLTAVQAVSKLTAFYRGAALKSVHLVKQSDNRIMRIKVDKLDHDLMDYKFNSGFFFEYDAQSLREITPVCSSKCQTLTYFGVLKDDLKKYLEEETPKGIDRIIPMGKSMDFSLVWDGHDLIYEL